jgi:hypothetical protein
MPKQKLANVIVFSAFAFTIMCLLSMVVTAQTGSISVSGVPLRGVDVKLGRNPGGTAAERILTTDSDGKIVVRGLEPGGYYLIVVDPSSQKGTYNWIKNSHDCVIEIKGLADGPISREWNAQERKFVTLPPKTTERTTNVQPRYEEKLNFDVSNEGSGSHSSVLTFIIKSKSNISSN